VIIELQHISSQAHALVNNEDNGQHIHSKCNCWGRFQNFVFKVLFQWPYKPQITSNIFYGEK